MTTDQVFQVQGGNPLTTGLDHIFDPVPDVDHAHAVQGRYVTGVQPAPGPELGAFLRFVVIALGEPGRTQHQFALGLAIGRQEVTLGIDNRCLHQRPWHAGLDPVGGAFVFAAGHQFIVEVRA
ncbi:hypothetical protein D3C84_680590 [compost metagenome]